MDAVDFYAEPANSIGYLSRMAFRAFSRALERRTAPHGVSSGQWRFLRVLWRNDGITQRELSRQVGLREPTTVIALKGMERAGLVRRRKSADDRRKAHVYLTPRARDLKQVLLPEVAALNALALAGLSAEEVEVLRRALAQVGRNLAEAGGEPASDSAA